MQHDPETCTDPVVGLFTTHTYEFMFVSLNESLRMFDETSSCF